MIPFCIFTILIIIGVCITLVSEKKKPANKNVNKISENEKLCGVNIQLSEEEKKAIAQKIEADDIAKFNKQKEELLMKIKQCKESSSDLLINKILDAILKIEINDFISYERVKFIFNDGDFRTNEEVEYFDKQFATQDKRDNYDKERKNISLWSFLISFLISFMISAGAFNDVILLPVALLIGILFGTIGLAVGHSINLSNAKDYCIPDNDPRVQDEKHKLDAAAIALIVESASMINHSKNAVKNVTNVDSWKEMN